MLSAKMCVEGVYLTISPWIVGCVRMLVLMNGEPLILCHCPPIMLTHPGNEVCHRRQCRGLARFVEQQELLGLDTHAAPTERTRIAKLRAVTIGTPAIQQVTKLMRAQGDQDGRQLIRIKIAEAQSKAERPTRPRCLQRQSTALVGTIGLRVILPRLGLARIGVLAVEIELATSEFAWFVIPFSIPVRHQCCLIPRAGVGMVRLFQVELNRARPRHAQLFKEGWRQKALLIAFAVAYNLQGGVDRDAAHKLCVIVLADPPGCLHCRRCSRIAAAQEIVLLARLRYPSAAPCRAGKGHAVRHLEHLRPGALCPHTPSGSSSASQRRESAFSRCPIRPR